MSNDFKMPIVLIGNSFKYEVEATSKMFFRRERGSSSSMRKTAERMNF